MRARKRTDSESGAVLVHVAVALLGLLAFSAFAVDYGVLWASRRQAQNSADAGALAGVIALGYDDYNDRTDTGAAKQSALLTALDNGVWGEAASVNVTSDVTFPNTPAECVNGATGISDCLRVDVYRTQARTNPLPTFFGWFFGQTDQDIRATATARIATANSSNCLRPWAVADKWDENNPVPGAEWDWTQTYDPTGGNPDVYVPQNGVDDAGTGFVWPDDVGTELRLKVGSPGDSQISAGWFQAIDLQQEACTGEGAACYEETIRSCVGGSPYGVGSDVPKENGNMTGPTIDGTWDLINLDFNADWDPNAGTNGEVVTSCAPGPCADGQYYTQSPRIVPIPVFDLDLYMQTGGPGSGTVRIVTILGFFVDRLEPTGGGGGSCAQGGGGQCDVVGYLVTESGILSEGAGSVSPSSSFIKAAVLIR